MNLLHCVSASASASASTPSPVALSSALSRSAIAAASLRHTPFMNFSDDAALNGQPQQQVSDFGGRQRCGVGGEYGERDDDEDDDDSGWSRVKQYRLGEDQASSSSLFGERELYRKTRAASEGESQARARAQNCDGHGAVMERGGAGRWRPRGAGDGRWLGRGRGGRGGGDGTNRGYGHNWRVRAAGGEFRRAGEFRRPGRFFESRNANERRWCAAQNELPASYEKFVIFSYNILADKNAAQHYSELYHHIPPWMMDWDSRKEKLANELGQWSPDIMCLQEVDKYEDLEEIFLRKKYRGVYKGRTGGALDGCAMFWKPSRFQLLQEESIQFSDLGLRDNVAQLCVFQSVGDKQPNGLAAAGSSNAESRQGPGGLVIVGNIHVLFNPKRGDVKLGQVRVLLESAHALSRQWGGAPVTIAGDFNSTPKSDLYKFLSTAELDISSLNRATMSGQTEGGEHGHMPWSSQPAVDFSSSSVGTDFPNAVRKKWHWTPEELIAATGRLDCSNLRHNLKLRSAYSQIRGERGCRDTQGEPLVTTFHRKFMGTVDYIWHTEGLDTVKVLDTLPVSVLQLSRGLPSKKWGSDHLAIACELAFLPRFEPTES